MQTLFWKTKKAVKTLSPTAFGSEDQFERGIFETPEILDDIFLIKRQVRGGNNQAYPTSLVWTMTGISASSR